MNLGSRLAFLKKINTQPPATFLKGDYVDHFRSGFITGFPVREPSARRPCLKSKKIKIKNCDRGSVDVVDHKD